MIRRKIPNAEIADVLERVADLLEAEGGDSWRVRGWRGGAATVRRLDRPIVEILDADGVRALQRLPAIGRSLSAAIAEYAESGRLDLLDRLEGRVTPRALFMTVPGIGEDLARRIEDALGLRTLEDLEAAAHDGRLERVPGFGKRRVRGVREALEAMLGRSALRRARRFDTEGRPAEGPPVATLLAVDREYREAAQAGRLERIAPRRFNPEHKAWLPVLRVTRDDWDLVATYSNTARAHELGATADWVVIRASRDPGEHVHTVVTERRGPLAGRRVVRGREAECAAHYAPDAASP